MEEMKNEVMNVENNGLISNTMEVFENKVKKFTSLDLSNEEEQVKLLNATQNCDIKLNDIIGTSIEVCGIYVIERPVESVSEDGEVKEYKKYVTMLFDTEGKSYVTGSSSCFNSIKDIIAIKGMPTAENVYKVKPIKVSAKTQGHSYLKLVLSK